MVKVRVRVKVVHVCLSMGYTEGLNYQENIIIKYQARDHHEVTLITTDHCFHEGEWGICQTSYDYVNPDGVHIIRLSFAFPIPYKFNKQIGIFKGFLQKLEQIQPDVIFVHNIQFQDIRTVAKYKKKHPEVRVYVDNHSDHSNSARNWLAKNTLYRFWWKPCAKKVAPYVETFFGVMPSRVTFLTDIYGVKKEQTDLLFMGADDEDVEWAAQPAVQEAFRKHYRIAEDDFLIVTGGKIDAFKTQTLLLAEAVQKLENPKVKLVIFGSIEETIKDKLLKLCDGEKVQYIGWAKGNQPYQYFAAADLVVFPGRHSVYWEQVVAQGKPMVCKYWDGTTHVDIGGNVHFLMEDSVDTIYQELQKILSTEGYFEKMKAAAEAAGREQFSYKRIARKSIGL